MYNINLFAGPNSGKSTLAAGLFYKMKIGNIKVEYTQEYAKELVYGNDTFKLSDQLLITSEQHHRVFKLKDKVDYLIHDSPFIMGLSYIKDNDSLPKQEYTDFLIKLFNSYNNINIFLERDLNHEYQQFGRYQTLDESIQKDIDIKKLLADNHIPYTTIKAGVNIDYLYDLIIN